ncbi:hypothetical protein [Leeuwenhoekiella sp. H156]|uniref:hypothetical protein n=1 Tax=Leeuwenhoekiella sp. H156 TaxID=3450128 RepID=UPI003FA40F4E
MKTKFTYININPLKITLFLLFINISVVAQTNIFPSNGAVGIGIANPQKSFHVYGPYGNSLYLDSGSDDGGRIFTDYDAGSAILTFQELDDPFILRFRQTAGSYENTINFSQGFFGFGVKFPKDILHITGNMPALRLSSQNYYGGSGGALNTVLSAVKFVNSDANEIYRAEVRGILTGGWATDVGFSFTTNSNGNQKERVRITHDGKQGINTSTPDEALTVKGKIHTQEVRVDLAGAVAPDYVFQPEYQLLTPAEIEKYIMQVGHLPNIPSAEDMEEEGLNLKIMNLKLLEKIEELTLYIIDQDKGLKQINNRLRKLENRE